MNGNTKFRGLTVVGNGIILKNGKKEEKEILFSEIADIYVKMYKLKPVYELAFILFPFLLVFLSVQYLALEKVVLIGFTAVVPVFVKINSYKRYGLVVRLKDGTVFRKSISLLVKGQYVSIVNAVRKEQLNYFAKTNTPCQSKVLEL